MPGSCTPACPDCGHLMSSHKDGVCKVCGSVISWKEVNDRFELIEKQQARIKELLGTIVIQMKEWKKKYPGS